MADYASTQYTELFLDTPQSNVKASDVGGKVRIAYAIWEADAVTMAIGDIVKMFRLPRGSTLISSVCTWTAITSAYIDIGWDGGVNGLETADQDGIVATLDVNAPGGFDSRVTNYIVNQRFDDEVTMQIYFVANSLLLTNDSIKLQCLYVVD